MRGILLGAITFLILNVSWAGPGQALTESYLGEKNLDGYAGRYDPLLFHNPYIGRLNFQDDFFYQNFFNRFIFPEEGMFSFFFKSELNSGLICSNETLSDHFDEIHYSYRLITLSYLIEAQWHMGLVSKHFNLKDSCGFDMTKWVDSCRPQSEGMKKFLAKLKSFRPKYEENLPRDYKLQDWLKEVHSKNYKWYSQYRLKKTCFKGCGEVDVALNLKNSCLKDQELMSSICSENDSIYGLSNYRDAYYLLGISNIINTYNKRGEALGCLRRFSEVMSHKEQKYEAIEDLFPVIQSFLSQRYQERFLQGRVFFYGSGQEFENKGLTKIYVEEQPFKVETIPQGPVPTTAAVKSEVKDVSSVMTKDAPGKTTARKEIKEDHTLRKSAFLQAAEIRSAQDLDRVEVDMTKLKYDFVFSLNMMNNLSEKLKTFMERESLEEMKIYDKLGSSQGPVPLLFLKFMMDMHEHQGLWNLIAVLGDKFYVSNEIDVRHKPATEFIQLVNNESTGRQWQFYILRP